MNAGAPVAEQLAHSLELLRRALDRSRLYGVQHPEATAAIEAVWAPLAEAIASAAPVVLQAGLDGLRWRGEVLLEETEDREGLGRLLHREGIASLTLHGTFTRTELVRFLDVARLNLALPEYEEETLESLLWQANLPGMAFKAVAELMEAEAISGDAVRYLQERGPGKLETILGEGGKSKGAVADDDLARAIEEAGDEVDLVAGEEGAWEESVDAWENSFVEALDEDAEAVARLRNEVTVELPGDQIRRACALLFRIARARRSDMRAGEAVALVRMSIAEVVRQRDTFALVQLINEARAAREQEHDDQVGRLIDNVLQQATQPTLIARMLAAAGPDADPAATAQLVDMLDDSAIQALIEWSFPAGSDADGSVERARWLATALGDLTAERARRWLREENTPPRLLEPAGLLLRGRDRPEDRALRAEMLAHPATRIQEIALDWYTATGIPDQEVDLVVARLDDRRPRVRRQTWPVLAAHRPPDMARWFRQRLSPRSLDAQPDDMQQDLCIGCARILGPSALPMLELLLERKVGLFAGRDKGRQLQAAALGIAAVGTPAALQLLQDGKSSWVGARSQACKMALDALDRGEIP